MRIISQDGKCDYPYENNTLFIDYTDGRVIRLLTLKSDDSGVKIAVYSTEEKAKKAMEMLRKAYEDNEYYHHIANSDSFAKIRSLMSKEQFQKSTTEYFQFPQDDEIEV